MITVSVELTFVRLTANCPLLVAVSEAAASLAVIDTVAVSLSVIVPCPWESVNVGSGPAPEVLAAFVRLTKKVSLASTFVSPFTETVRVFVGVLVEKPVSEVALIAV